MAGISRGPLCPVYCELTKSTLVSVRLGEHTSYRLKFLIILRLGFEGDFRRIRNLYAKFLALRLKFTFNLECAAYEAVKRGIVEVSVCNSGEKSIHNLMACIEPGYAVTSKKVIQYGHTTGCVKK